MNAMPLHSMIRLAAILITSVFVVATNRNETAWLSMVYILGFGHYFMSLLYSKKQVKQVLERPYSRWSLVGLFLLGFFTYRYQFPLVIYFGIHHAFNEVYLLNRTIRPQVQDQIKALRTAGVLLNFLVYLFLLRGYPELQLMNAKIILFFVSFSYVFFFYILFKLRTDLKVLELIDNCALEVLSIFFLIGSFFFSIRFTDIVCFHFFFWMLYPVPKLIRTERLALYRYLGLTILTLVPAFLLSPYGLVSYGLQGSFFQNQFILWSFIHITVSFALSDSHPAWITRWFKPREVYVLEPREGKITV